jgi:hypothetical protein
MVLQSRVRRRRARRRSLHLFTLGAMLQTTQPHVADDVWLRNG